MVQWVLYDNSALDVQIVCSSFQDISSAGIVLIMARSCQPALDDLTVSELDEPWRYCVEILRHMASFNLSARKTLTFLEAIHNRLVSCRTGELLECHIIVTRH